MAASRLRGALPASEVEKTAAAITSEAARHLHRSRQGQPFPTLRRTLSKTPVLLYGAAI